MNRVPVKRALVNNLEEKYTVKDEKIEELRVYTMFMEGANKLYPALKNFPTHERQGIVLIIKKLIISINGKIRMANKIPKIRLKTLREVEEELYKLSGALEFAVRLRYISIPFHRELTSHFIQVNMLLTGYIKFTISNN